MTACLYKLDVIDEVICLEDLEGPRSLTNDVEAVLEDIQRGGILLDAPVIYRDSDGRWDEIRHAKGKFTRFAPLGHLPKKDIQDRDAAVQAVKLSWGNDQVMLDLETIGLRPDAGILSIGAVRFDPRNPTYSGEGFYCTLDVEAQKKSGASYDYSTLAWWESQAPQIREQAFIGSQNSVHDDLVRFRNFVLERPESLLWSKGPAMDSVILQSLFRRTGIDWPFSYRADRDVRTVEDLAQGRIDYDCPELKALEGLEHNALADARWQAYVVWMGYRGLGLQRSN